MGTYRGSLIAAMVVFLVINSLAIAARLFVRMRLLTRAFGLDDFALCLVFVSFPVACVFSRRMSLLSEPPSSRADIGGIDWLRDSLRLGVRINVLGLRGP